MDVMLHRTWGRLGASDTSASFLPLSFRLFASFGLLVLHAALPVDVRAAGPGEWLYLAALVLMFAEAAWESGRGLMALDQLFPTPRNGWIRWNLGLDLALVSLVIAFQGVMQERFATLYIFPVLASAFYLGTVEIVWVGVLSSLTHVVLVLGFTFGVLPSFGLSGPIEDPDPGRLSFLLGIASLQVLATTLILVLIRRNLDRLRSDLTVSEAAVDELSALHQRVVESMHSGLITMDMQGHVTRPTQPQNPSWGGMFPSAYRSRIYSRSGIPSRRAGAGAPIRGHPIGPGHGWPSNPRRPSGHSAGCLRA